jgi:hypothetical protein
MKAWAPALPALLAACGPTAECLPAASSPERQAFREQLPALVHRSQCPGLPVPKEFGARTRAMFEREQALVARVRASRLKPDLDEAIRHDQEMSRNVFEADCAMWHEGFAETPEGRRRYLDQLRNDERRLRDAEQAFAALTARCEAPQENR